MKTDILDASKNVPISTISLDGFIVKETLAKDALVHTTVIPSEKRVFTAADLWNIQRKSKAAGWRR